MSKQAFATAESEGLPIHLMGQVFGAGDWQMEIIMAEFVSHPTGKEPDKKPGDVSDAKAGAGALREELLPGRVPSNPFLKAIAAVRAMAGGSNKDGSTK